MQGVKAVSGDWPYLWLDAAYLKREGRQIVCVAAVCSRSSLRQCAYRSLCLKAAMLDVSWQVDVEKTITLTRHGGAAPEPIFSTRPAVRFNSPIGGGMLVGARSRNQTLAVEVGRSSSQSWKARTSARRRDRAELTT